MEVPEVLLSGHEAKINEWRFEASVRRTRERRPDLWAKSGLGESDLKSNKK
jgi:tRNA (guanine37-N1)-methyltransferase